MRAWTIALVAACAGCGPGTTEPTQPVETARPELTFTQEQAEQLASLPVRCAQTEYPNRLGQTLGDSTDLASPRQLHPAFFGCFDWHSAVHGHWSLVRLLRDFPDQKHADSMWAVLEHNITVENIAAELRYFRGKHNATFERTYGWAWLFRLHQELSEWPSPRAQALAGVLEPLAVHLGQQLQEFLPKLQYPIRVGTHSNTAFGLSFAWDWALSQGDTALQQAIRQRATAFYQDDSRCPLEWEPSGYDFLSPCLEEVDLMRRVLSTDEFSLWLDDFLPQLSEPGFTLEVARVGDREDGLLVHLDGLNFSRAWVLYGLAAEYPRFDHLLTVADAHMAASLPSVADGNYEGEHWLATFAIYALHQRSKTL